MKAYREEVLEAAGRKARNWKRMGRSEDGEPERGLNDSGKIIFSFAEFLEEAGLSVMGLSRHLGELEELGCVRKTGVNGKRVYEMQKVPSVEELVVESLVNHLGAINCNSFVRSES